MKFFECKSKKFLSKIKVKIKKNISLNFFAGKIIFFGEEDFFFLMSYQSNLKRVINISFETGKYCNI